MKQKSWWVKAQRILWILSCLLWITWTPHSASGTASILAGKSSLSPGILNPGLDLTIASANLHFMALTAGGKHTCGLDLGNGVKCWGMNFHGELGDGNGELNLHSSVPVSVVGLGSGVIAIAAGEEHTCALLTGGGIKCWGLNEYGQLGDGTQDERHTPVDVAGLGYNVTDIATGWNHTCALDSGGGMKCWGGNDRGQLGDGTTTDSSTPVDVIGLSSGVIAIAAGQAYTCALSFSGGVKCWGFNYSGQLGDSTGIDRSTPVDVIGLSSGVTFITVDDTHTCGLLSSGEVKCWGSNNSDQLGDGTGIDSSTPVDVIGLSGVVTAIAAGDMYTCALLSVGGVECWGGNSNGMLGDGTTRNSKTPVGVVGLADVVTAITSGFGHTCALLSDGRAECWGMNEYGQLGDGRLVQRSLPVDVIGLSSGVTSIAAGESHTCTVSSDGGVKCWGKNWIEQSGVVENVNQSTPVDVVGLSSNNTAIAAGASHICALNAEGGVKCWGMNYYGQLGDGTTTDSSTPVDVMGLSSGVTAIAAGGVHTCAVLSGGGVKCWGWNVYGQLGDGNSGFYQMSSVPVDVVGLTSGVMGITASLVHTCALISDGGVKCWGGNEGGQLGDGTYMNRSTPVDVIGLGSMVTAITAGGYAVFVPKLNYSYYGHTCALILGGGVNCWGSNMYGQLGSDIETFSTTPVDVNGLASGVTAIAAGETHTCALVSEGGVKCWGDNEFGELGDGTRAIRSVIPVNVVGLSGGVVTIAAGGIHTCALVSAGRPYCWGSDVVGQLGIGIKVISFSTTPVDLVEAGPLTRNYANGQPGSFFTITGWNFPPDSQAVLSINGQVITNTLAVNATGSFLFFMDTTGAETGLYAVTVGENPAATISFVLDESLALRPQEGAGQIFNLPAGIAYRNFSYFPLAIR